MNRDNNNPGDLSRRIDAESAERKRLGVSHSNINEDGSPTIWSRSFSMADAADVLTTEQRRKISDMLPGGGGWGMDRGPGPRWGWGGFWRH